jgi:hypothetical protein
MPIGFEIDHTRIKCATVNEKKGAVGLPHFILVVDRYSHTILGKYVSLAPPEQDARAIKICVPGGTQR